MAISKGNFLKISKQEAIEKIQAMILEGKNIQAKRVNDLNTWKKIEHSFNKWNSSNYETLKRIFSKNSIAKEYSASGWSVGRILLSELKLDDKISKLQKNATAKLEKLDSILKSIQIFSEDEKPAEGRQKIFFVFGTSSSFQNKVFDFLKSLDLEPVILNELAAAGKTLIDQIQEQKMIKQAVILLTPDLIGGEYNKEQKFYSDQNVILELGIFIGAFKRKNVFALYKENVELPADYHGFNYIKIDATNNWRTELEAALKATDLKFD